MSGAWEWKATRQVLCGILHVDTTTIHWALGLRNLHLPGTILPVAGQPFDMARNTICHQALVEGFEYVFFLDSDVVPPRDAVLRLMAHHQPIISGQYCRRSPPAAVPVMIRGGQWVTNYPQGATIEVDLVGAGCLLIHRSVLERLPPLDAARGKRWFDWRVDMRGIPGVEEEGCLSEDFSFCHHARKNGYRVLVDTSIRCKHVGYAESDYGTFQPAEARVNT